MLRHDSQMCKTFNFTLINLNLIFFMFLKTQIDCDFISYFSLINFFYILLFFFLTYF